MAQFKHKTNGVILTTNNKDVIEQLKKNAAYTVYKKKDAAPDADDAAGGEE